MTQERAQLSQGRNERQLKAKLLFGTTGGQTRRLRQSLLALAIQLLPWLLAIVLFYLVLLPLAQWLNAHEISFVGDDLTLSTKWARFLLALEITRRYFDRLYEFDESGVTEHMGMLSTSYRLSRIRYEDIREIKIEQGLTGRLLGFGTVKLSTASTNGYEVTLKNVTFPDQLVRTLLPEKGEEYSDSSSSE
ncbi:MAG: PH domain-containing protein [Bdellovibrionales bacterium]|nr:PH domain-containing protein [Bdellovibrionales bacterium]